MMCLSQISKFLEGREVKRMRYDGIKQAHSLSFGPCLVSIKTANLPPLNCLHLKNYMYCFSLQVKRSLVSHIPELSL